MVETWLVRALVWQGDSKGRTPERRTGRGKPRPYKRSIPSTESF